MMDIRAVRWPHIYIYIYNHTLLVLFLEWVDSYLHFCLVTTGIKDVFFMEVWPPFF